MLNEPSPELQFLEFRSLLDRYADLAAGAGKTTYRSPPELARARFLSQDDKSRTRRILRLRQDIVILEDSLREGSKDATRMLWRFLAKSGYTPCSDIFDKIDPTDVIEVYGVDQIHLWQNLNFFDWISVPLESIYCETWYELTRRDAQCEAQYFELAKRLLGGEIRGTVVPEVPWHRVEELDSVRRQSFDMHMKYLSPVYQGATLAGMITVVECRDLR